MLKAQDSNFAELVDLMYKEHRTEEEQRRMRELSHAQAVGLLEDWRPEPSDEDIKQLIHKHLAEQYGL